MRIDLPQLPVAAMCNPVTVIGTVLDPPSGPGTSMKFRLAVCAVLTDTSSQRLEATALVALRSAEVMDRRAVPGYGMTVALHGYLEYPRPVRNPGEFDAREFFRANGIDLLLSVKGSRHICVLDSSGGSWAMCTLVVPVRNALLAHIDRQIGGEEGEFLKGLMIGERGGLTQQMCNAFLVSGVAHILAVSGSNVAVVAAALVAVLLLLRVPRRMHAVPVAAGLLLYMVLTGSQPSVVRATIMALVVLVVSCRGIRGNPLNAVGIAALIMYGLDPRQLFDMGFQLSFAAVLSIVLLYPRVMRHVRLGNGRGWFYRSVRAGLGVAVVSLVASVGTFPLTAGAFGQVSLIGVLANIIVVPVSGWSVVLGLLSAALDPVSSNAAGSLCALNAVALSFTLHVVRICAELPCAAMSTGWFEPLYALPFLGLLGTAYHAGNPPLRRCWCLFALLTANVAAYVPGRTEREPGTFAVTYVDVGQGDAILLEHPDGGSVLIDTGPVPFNSRGGLVPFLQRQGIATLDIVLVTHPHDDHTGGLTAVCSVLTVRKLVTYDSAEGGTVIDWKPDCRLQVLYALPRAPTGEQGAPDPNRLSVVVRLVYGNTAFLFAADAEQEEEERLIAAYGAGLESTVLKVGHHGSASATTADWLDAVRPAHAIISVGRRNRFGHPADAVLRRLQERGIAVARTDEDGPSCWQPTGGPSAGCTGGNRRFAFPHRDEYTVASLAERRDNPCPSPGLNSSISANLPARRIGKKPTPSSSMAFVSSGRHCNLLFRCWSSSTLKKPRHIPQLHHLSNSRTPARSL
jgi:competence protein ComEC